MCHPVLALEQIEKFTLFKQDAIAKSGSIPVVFEVCDGSEAQKWTWAEGDGAIVHAATGMCLQFEESGK